MQRILTVNIGRINRLAGEQMRQLNARIPFASHSRSVSGGDGKALAGNSSG
jgi:hypothetical protein